MTYTPGIPNSTDNISVSQGQIKTNFQQLDSIFDNDHYKWDDATSGGAYRGYHRQVYFPVASASDPALGGFESVFFSKDDTNDISLRAQLYFKNVTATYQVTNRFQNAATNGYAMIAGGIILMWGVSAQATSGNHSINFNTITNYTGAPTGFPNNCFSVNFTIQTPSSGTAPTIVLDQTTPFTQTQFNIRVSASVANTSIYWFAVGN